MLDAGTEVLRLEDGRDGAGRIVEKRESRYGVTLVENYGYDLAGRQHQGPRDDPSVAAMRVAIMNRMILLATLFVAAVSAAALGSTVTVAVEHHTAVAESSGTQRVLRTAFIEDPLIATVKLDVYALPELPSTGDHLDQLKRLNAESWLKQLQWEVRDVVSGDLVEVEPRAFRASARERGPDARAAADRDTSVSCTSYEARFDLGRLPAGDYSIRVHIEGLESPPFPLAVRTGLEAEVRDVYLQEKARKTTDWGAFKEMQLERLRLDPNKAAALIELAERALVSGSLEEATLYLGRAADAMEQNLARWAKLNPEDAKRQAPGVETAAARMRALRAMLPDYFAHRAEWSITTDPATGNYVIRSKRDGMTVREIR
jgi:hypothetical protein